MEKITEASSVYEQLDQMSTLELLNGINEQDQQVAHAVALDDGVTSARGELPEGLGQQRCRTRHEQAHARAGGGARRPGGHPQRDAVRPGNWRLS